MSTTEQDEKIVAELGISPRKCKRQGCPNPTKSKSAKYCSGSCGSIDRWSSGKPGFKDRPCFKCKRDFTPTGATQRKCRRPDCKKVETKVNRKSIQITEKDKVSRSEAIAQEANFNRSEEIVLQETEKLCVAAEEAYSAMGRALGSAFRIEAFGIAYGRKTISVEQVRSMLQVGLEARSPPHVPQGVLLGEVPTESEHYKDEVSQQGRPGKRSKTERVRSDG